MTLDACWHEEGSDLGDSFRDVTPSILGQGLDDLSWDVVFGDAETTKAGISAGFG